MSRTSLLLLTILPAGLAVSASAFVPFQSGGPLGPPPDPPENPTTPEKAVLGKILFWDEQLSSDDTVACGTCHIPSASFTDPRPRQRHPGFDDILGNENDLFSSAGMVLRDANGDYQSDSTFRLHRQLTPRRTNDLFGAAYAPMIFWDGHALDTFIDPQTGSVSIPTGGALESQAAVPILSEVEMAFLGRTWNDVITKLQAVAPLRLATDWPADVANAIATDPTYPDLFENAFGTTAITAERICFALAAYQRTLVPDETPWDDFITGNTAALTPDQKQGWQEFNGPANCHLCHEPPVFSDGDFHNNGIRHWRADHGLMEVTGLWADRAKFKTPSLRNVGLRNAFFHTGTATEFNQVKTVYLNGGGLFRGNLDPQLQPLSGTGVDLDKVFDFITNGLTDPRVANELPPFDRPTLYSERVEFGSNLYGRFAKGSSGRKPAFVGHHQPAYVGNDEFELGVQGGLGGAEAWLVVSFQSSTGRRNGVPTNVGRPYDTAVQVFLPGSGTDDGWAGVDYPIPNDPNLIGEDLFAQWFVMDPGAPNGVAAATKGATWVIQ